MKPRVSVRHFQALSRAISSPRWFVDERLWSFFTASLIAEDPDLHIPSFCGESLQLPVGGHVACEAEPVSTRFRENNTVLDIAFGHVTGRTSVATATTAAKETLAGISYGPESERSWVCFVEAKLLSDCDCKVTNDPLRNQLTRVIENLLCFQDGNARAPRRLYFALLTPRAFRENPKARLYGYKMADFADPAEIRAEIEACRLERRGNGGYCFPDLSQRLPLLAAPRWVTFEEVLEAAGLGEGLDVIRRPGDLAGIHAALKTRLMTFDGSSRAGASL